MNKYYVTGKIAQLDLGAEIEAVNSFMAGIKFKETYKCLLSFGSHELLILDAELL